MNKDKVIELLVKIVSQAAMIRVNNHKSVLISERAEKIANLSTQALALLKPCQTCGGSRQVRKEIAENLTDYVGEKIRCQKCHGEGHHPAGGHTNKCYTCNGTGEAVCPDCPPEPSGKTTIRTGQSSYPRPTRRTEPEPNKLTLETFRKIERRVELHEASNVKELMDECQPEPSGEFVCEKCSEKLPIYLRAIHQGNKYITAKCKGKPEPSGESRHKSTCAVYSRPFADCTCGLEIRKHKARIEELEVVATCWRDYKKVAKEFGFPDKYTGGINRWTQDKLTENQQLEARIKAMYSGDLSPESRLNGYKVITDSLVERRNELLLENQQLTERIKELEAIADLAFDIHTRDPVNVKAKWGVCGARAEELLCDKIDKIKGVKDGPGIPKAHRD